MTARDRAEGVTVTYSYWKWQGLSGEDLRQKLQDLIEAAIRDAVVEAMVHRGKMDDALKTDAALFRWMNGSPAHQAAVRLAMERGQNLSLRAAAIAARNTGEKENAA